MKQFRIVAVGFLCALVGVLIAVVVNVNKTADGTVSDKSLQSAAQPAGPADVTGTWVSDNMTANVTDAFIEVNWSSADVTGLYWKGTFQATANNGDKIVSIGDTEAMSMAMLASQDSEKEFVYEKESITFKRTVAGVVQMVRLTRAPG